MGALPNLLQIERGTSPDQTLEVTLQRHKATQLAWLSTASLRNNLASPCWTVLHCVTVNPTGRP